MKIKCPICGELTELDKKEVCSYCGSSVTNIRKTLLRQKENSVLAENTAYTTRELEELFEFEPSGTGYAIKEYLGLENRVFVPAKYRGKTINAISPHSFEGSDVEEIYLPDSIRVIMHHAFCDCYKLKKIVISNRCKSIGHYAFANCISLQTLSIPESTSEIGKYAFSGCVNLCKILLPEKLEIIEEGLFENCTSLPYFIVPSKVRIISSYAFSNCTGITKIKFNDGLISIGDSAFSGCISLERVLLSETVTTMGENSFQDCKKLKALYVGKSLAELSGLPFYGCDNLSAFKVSEQNLRFSVLGNGMINTETQSLVLGGKNTDISETLKGISGYAFCGVAFTTEKYIPETIISVEANSFYNTANFEIKVAHGAKPSQWSESWFMGENKVLWGEHK